MLFAFVCNRGVQRLPGANRFVEGEGLVMRRRSSREASVFGVCLFAGNDGFAGEGGRLGKINRSA